MADDANKEQTKPAAAPKAATNKRSDAKPAAAPKAAKGEDMGKTLSGSVRTDY